ncbi:unnamed protein product [Schistosoma rodhaini]|uniref:Uncharacterized protein n=1 Tax=Schistosoma rodhaini TaxID=6188 RepID=A0AA85FAU2_9TREM|nr:unnamed protein product [Schistosoma rodhaini]
MWKMIFLLCLITYVNFITSNPTTQSDYLLQAEANTTSLDITEHLTGEFTVTEMSSTSTNSEPIIKSDHDTASVEEVTSNEPYETTTESDETNDTEHNLDFATDNHHPYEHHNDNHENHEDDHDHEHDHQHDHEHDHEHYHEHEHNHNKADQSFHLSKNIHKRTRGKHSDSTNPKKVNKL